MKNTTILVSGASVGGPALAFWLDRHGFDVTVVERAPGPRPGGQAIDVRGPALEVVERMGLLEQLRGLSTGMRGMTMVDAEGNELYRSTEHTITGGDVASPDVEIMRDDLARLLIEAGGDRTEYLFDDSIATLTQDGDGVAVTFERSAPRTFDLVVGADGLHSTVRSLAFGPESEFIHHLGTYLSVFTVPNFLDLDHWQVFCQAGPVGGGIMSARDNTEARAYLGFESAEPIEYDHRDVDAQKRLMAERMADAGWEFPTALKHMWDAPDFHFDSMAQIRMDSWSRGRVVLLGDAGYCGSPMSGQGTSMALVGAYVLAGELKAAGGDHGAAFAGYERELREYVTQNQQLALTNKARVEAQAAAAMGEGEPTEAPEEVDFQDFGEVVNALALKDY
ncbi:FAD-dependent oxidoreductase [Solihabitans fulvus]|uniref:FAD-dependent oxidoreductase n=1 Tax=Solihabitans fulvus TaxID=1892852 RepID=A0A5B2WUH8_9PSEU|nr:FAD-dependent monooxygenase [Solihabitans fulvus]KAA2254520.1 FAD-dependent oxidoreductase [Solihabitans fulvus]